MKEYFISLLAVGLLSMLTNALCHDDGGSTAKNVRLLCALAVICVSIAPLKSFITSLTEKDFSIDGIKQSVDESEYENKFLDGLMTANEEAIKLSIKDMLANKFEINPDNLKINIEADRLSATPKLIKITVILSKTAIFKNPYDIEKAVRDIYKCECDVAVE